jgi:hypothetical protein
LECPVSDDECEAAAGIDDQHIRSKELFITKTCKPLFSELLALSFFAEVEVNALLSSSFQLSTVLTSFCWFAVVLIYIYF